MRSSVCGRIVSQKSSEAPLLRRYDTNSAANLDRITQLKRKYNKEETEAELVAFSSTQLPSQLVLKSTVRLHEHQFKQGIDKRHVEVDMSQFVRKAEETNTKIDSKLSCIEEEISRYKLQLEKRKHKENRQQLITRKQERTYKKRQVSQEKPSHMPQSIEIKLFDRGSRQVNESSCQLLGQFKAARLLSQQFAVLVNRLKDQISLDSDFTQIVLALPPGQRLLVREHIRRDHPSADLQFFAISPTEQDPLQPQPPAQPKQPPQVIARRLHEFYLKIEEHFGVKLVHRFALETVEALFEEIGQKEVTLGHLVSYINMRTGKQFRNRAVVKLLRRVGIDGQLIRPQKFICAFVKL